MRTLLAIALFILSSTAALADPRFATATAAITGDGDLRVRWNERGLEPGDEVDYRVTANASAAYACQNSGGQFPGNQETTKVSGAVEVLATFNSGARKNIRGAVEVGALESDLSCPNGQSVTLVCAEYAQIRLRDLTNGLLRRLGEQSKNFFADEFPNC